MTEDPKPSSQEPQGPDLKLEKKQETYLYCSLCRVECASHKFKYEHDHNERERQMAVINKMDALLTVGQEIVKLLKERK